MWKELAYLKPLFISCLTENGYRISVTDYINIWSACYKEKDFLSLLKKCNDDLELESDNQLLQLGLKMILQPEKLKKLNVNFVDKTLNISMLMSCGFPLYLELKLIEGSKEMFFTIITQPLLKTVQDLKMSENELRFLLIKKDKEIEEYKTETDVRLAMYLKTGVYCDERHMGKHPMYENHFGTLDVPKSLLETMKDNSEEQVIVKQESVQIEQPKVKIEPESQHSVKTEHNITESETQTVSNSTMVKSEMKNEPQYLVSPKKKPKKMLKI